ncbi:CDP-diacylglycerol--serine O-phosphatidyltransferase [Priestia filamentosa]|uniref:CDP-diacylglycerol--serine O-phosphatidyltransferase n=1 Tax=Priestia filamentosa TaxID=1402861 RepID=UPI0005890D01
MIIRNIPNIFTLSNLFCGFLSIVFSADGDLKNAAILIIIGMMLDSMDGRLARMLNVQSEIGKELDSLADIVTFGVAPSILVYYTSFDSYGLIGLIVAGLFPLFGAYRLARFNVDKDSSHHFIGVPITAAGGILTILCTLHQWIPNLIIDASFMALCFLMISKYKIPSFKNIPLPRYGTIISILLGCILFLIYKNKHSEMPYFIYVAVPLYIAFIGYRISKRKQVKKEKKTLKS